MAMVTTLSEIYKVIDNSNPLLPGEKRDVSSVGIYEGPRCSKCGQKPVKINDKFRPPKYGDIKAWRKVEINHNTRNKYISLGSAIKSDYMNLFVKCDFKMHTR